ncbi:unnamed protein product [Caenorhabditis angaria]|uniref:Peptidase M16 N-terminal domain-containing protein n=1 Tax=Caenorhabditis angaria TaxID=860376 RepID=A0A9P1NC04_9PELO|nr:unnamed protein product [Caenorhabditis angaria]
MLRTSPWTPDTAEKNLKSFGGEYRLASNNKFAHVIVAGEGAAGNNAKAVAAQAVLLAALGNSSPVKFSTQPNGTIAKAVGSDVTVNAFQAVHSDSGLAGIYIVSEANKVAATVSSVVGALKSFKVADIEAVKKQALNNALRAKAHSDVYSVERAAQLLTSSDNYISQIANVSTADVEAAAQRLVKKLSISSYGNISQVPYVDSL